MEALSPLGAFLLYFLCLVSLLYFIGLENPS